MCSEADGITIVGEAATAAEALRRIPATRPDVAILDARLPDGSGIDVCRDVRSSMPAVRCLILTSYDDADAVFAAVMGGASGYLLKQIRGTSLVDAVRQVAAGRSLLDPARDGTAADPAAAGNGDRSTVGDAHRSGAGDPRLDRRRAHQPADRRPVVPRREDGQELCLRLLAKLGMQRRTQAAVYGATIRDRVGVPARTALRRPSVRVATLALVPHVR